jgi:alpha-beta hydrolase superfamily lysophospholipase
MKSTQKI